MFGIYEFCEKFLGIPPLYFFSDITPKKKNNLKLINIQIESKEPTVKYRGWFINDEYLLLGFLPNDGKRKTNYKFYDNVINPNLMSRIVEALVRTKFNMIIPSSFLDVDNPAEIKLLNEARSATFM